MEHIYTKKYLIVLLSYCYSKFYKRWLKKKNSNCEFIILKSWRPEVQNESHWAKIKVLTRLSSFWML